MRKVFKLGLVFTGLLFIYLFGNAAFKFSNSKKVEIHLEELKSSNGSILELKVINKSIFPIKIPEVTEDDLTWSYRYGGWNIFIEKSEGVNQQSLWMYSGSGTLRRGTYHPKRIRGNGELKFLFNIGNAVKVDRFHRVTTPIVSLNEKGSFNVKIWAEYLGYEDILADELPLWDQLFSWRILVGSHRSNVVHVFSDGASIGGTH